MSIKPLPEDVIAQIKSSTVITSLNNVVDGLLRNSLDAEATQVNISVNYGRGSCSVEDNGQGITPAEFIQSGGLGKSYREAVPFIQSTTAALQRLTSNRHFQASRLNGLSWKAGKLSEFCGIPVPVGNLIAPPRSCLAQLLADPQR